MGFIPRLEAEWTFFQTHQKNADFDFGVTSSTTIFGDDKNVISALTFLRFRDETGIPFRIGHTYSDNKAAGGAAERLARYYPDTAILTLVRADAEKTVERHSRAVFSALGLKRMPICSVSFILVL